MGVRIGVVITTTRDLMVYSLADFERLPEDGMFEVLDGRAILMPGGEIPHQLISASLFGALQQRIGPKARVLTTVNVFIPRQPGAVSALRVKSGQP
jgi:hypothetical protein